MVEQLAWITASAGDCRRAAGLLGAARTLREDAGTTVATGDPEDERYHARCEAEIRKALGQAGFERAMAGGAAIEDPEQAIAYALARDSAAEPAAAPDTAGPLTRREEEVAALSDHAGDGGAAPRLLLLLDDTPGLLSDLARRLAAGLPRHRRIQAADMAGAHTGPRLRARQPRAKTP
jgi:hypothetical protein